MSLNGYATYKTASTQTGDSRDVEYRLLAQVTSALIQARDDINNVKKRCEAAAWNRDVWAALRTDLTDESNRLPRELRASLISVSLWIEKETFAVMDNTGDIDALIDVNRNIMAGLKPDLHEDPAAAQQS